MKAGLTIAAPMVLAVLAFLMMEQTAHAEARGGLQVIEEILVVAPRIARERRERAGAVDLRLVERDEFVSLTDLDLRRTADVRTLERRIEEAAQRICRELAEEHPFGEPSTPVCVRRAVEDAMGQVQEWVERAIAAD